MVEAVRAAQRGAVALAARVADAPRLESLPSALAELRAQWLLERQPGALPAPCRSAPLLTAG